MSTKPDTNLTLIEKVAKIQQMVDGLNKEADNPYFKSKYVNLNQIIDALRPLELDNKISITMPLTNIDGRPALMLRIIDLDDTTNNEAIASVITLPDILDPQKMGSAITYYRRYMLMSFFNLKAEDDDGEFAASHPKKSTSTIGQKSIMDEDLDEAF